MVTHRVHNRCTNVVCGIYDGRSRPNNIERTIEFTAAEAPAETYRFRFDWQTGT